ncbi:hypothetical protein Tco_1243750 [Tanacetum coccineum]
MITTMRKDLQKNSQEHKDPRLKTSQEGSIIEWPPLRGRLLAVFLVKKKGIKHCKRWYWCDPKLKIKWYRTQLYELHLLLNPSQREELENELTSREELAVLQVEFANMEGQMQQLMEELKKS